VSSRTAGNEATLLRMLSRFWHSTRDSSKPPDVPPDRFGSPLRHVVVETEAQNKRKSPCAREAARSTTLKGVR
jgi:hypothetical protein